MKTLFKLAGSGSLLAVGLAFPLQAAAPGIEMLDNLTKGAWELHERGEAGA